MERRPNLWRGGIVVDYFPNDERVVFIEGNTPNPGGDPNGLDGVHQKIEKASPAMVFIRIDPNAEGAQPVE
jgi:hypothetical protein